LFKKSKANAEENNSKTTIINKLKDINMSDIYVIALTKRDQNNLKKSTYEVIINTLLVLNKEQKKLNQLIYKKPEKKKLSHSKGNQCLLFNLKLDFPLKTTN
jgi:hypothetical protein